MDNLDCVISVEIVSPSFVACLFKDDVEWKQL